MIKAALLKLKINILIKKLLKRQISLGAIALSKLRSDANILEAGAHVGFDTIVLAGLTRGTVYAFEPVPKLYNELKDRVKSLQNVKTFQLALGSVNEPMTMYLSSGQSDASSSLLKPKQHINTNPDVFFEDKLTVTVETLATWAAKNNVQRIDFMWLDMQGAELDMLKNAGSLINSVEQIYTEVSNIELYENQAVYSDLKEWLFDKGFKLYAEELTWGYTGNVLFVR